MEKDTNAIDIVRQMVTDGQVSQKVAERYFPELEESEDEKIRESLIETLNGMHSATFPLRGFSREQYITWLELHKARVIYQQPNHIGEDNDGNLVYADNEKHGEQKPITHKYNVGATIYYNSFGETKSMVVANVVDIGNGNPMYEDTDGSAVFEKDIVEPKTAEKVEPKFKVGDWVVWDNKISCHVDNIFQGKNSLMYTITDTNNMVRSYSVKGFDNNAHLWTIKDAKEGDVLLSPSTPEGDKECPFIFEEIDKDGVVRYYIALLQSENIKVTDGVTNVMGYANAGYHTPATKEQRDLLFRKMKEKGYVWNEEWSPKVEQKPAWSEEDEEALEVAIIALEDMYSEDSPLDCYAGHHMTFDKAANQLKSLKERVQPKQEWSKEDEQMLNDIIKDLVHPWNEYIPDRIEDEIIWLKNRLKSLRPQNIWKPSDEQMKALEYYIEKGLIDKGGVFGMCIVELYAQLKKLREE